MIKVLYNTFRLNSIQSIITLSSTILTISAILFIGVVLYNKFSHTAEKNALISVSQIMDQVNVNLSYYLKGMNEVSNLINEEINTASIYNNSSLENSLKMTLKLRKDIVALAVLSEQGELLASSSDFDLKSDLDISKEDWFRKVVAQPDRLHFSSPHVQNMFKGQHKWVVSLSRQVTYVQNNRRIRGISLVDMNFSAIDELCSKVSIGKRGYIYIIDKDGNIIYHPQQQMIYAGLRSENTGFAVNREDGNYVETYNGERTVVSIKTVNYTDWKIVGINYYNEMVTTKRDILYFFIFLLVFSILIVFFLSLLISARISRPIKKLDKIMKMVEQGELNIHAEVNGEDEVKQLSRTFNLMILKIRQLMDQIIKEQEEKRKNELKALQAQINPHFLYNTLDSIVWMSENNENQGAITMVTALANLFRISISRGDELINIGDELEHARSYLIIQQIRYEDKFDFVIEAEAEVLKYKSLKIILQPLIENSIYHGIKRMVDKGMIKIIAGVVNDKICLEVSDNGLGMSPEKVSNILQKNSKGKGHSGIGVKNVHERIQLYFGSEYGLSIESELDEGTCIKIWLPKCGVEEG